MLAVRTTSQPLDVECFRNGYDWSLHPQLVARHRGTGRSALSRVLLIKDANYPWLMLVPRRPDIVEIIDLDEVDAGPADGGNPRSRARLKTVTRCDKLNIAAWATQCRNCMCM